MEAVSLATARKSKEPGTLTGQQMFGFSVALAFAGLMCSLGCSRRPKTPDWNPNSAADACMEQYDSDSDGFLDKKELAVSPPLNGAARYLDLDGDKKLSREEIFTRIETYQRVNVNMQALVEVTVKNRKLLDAEIEFIPEDFLTGFISPASGKIESTIGMANMTSEGARYSDSVHVGLYRVKITSPSVQIRKEYNEETILGCEVSPVMIPGSDSSIHRFEVKVE